MSNTRRRRSNSKKSRGKYRLSISLCVLLLFLTVPIAYLFGIMYVTNTSIFSGNIKSFIHSVNDSKKLSFVRNTIHNNYIGDFDSVKLIDSAATAMIESIGDEYSKYIKVGQEESKSNDKKFGIGIEGVNSYGKIVVTGLLNDSVAQQIGIIVGDYIVNINGQEVDESNIDILSQSLISDESSKISLVVDRHGERLEFNDIELREISLPEVKNVEYRKVDDKIGYIRINEFEEGVYDEFRSALEELKPEGIIFDLRYNPGGDIDESNKVISEFLTEGSIIYVDDYKGGRKEIAKATKGIAEDVEIVVLGNGETASASESLIGALRDNNRGVFVGTKTFGKGLTQIPFSFKDGSEVVITSAKSYLPSGEYIDGVGIVPDVEVEYSQDLYVHNKIQANGDLELFRQLDPQYQKALEIIRQKIG